MDEAPDSSSKPNSMEENAVASSQEETALGEVEALRYDVEAGLRFLHLLSMQMKKVLFDSASQNAALIEELTTSFGLDHARLDARQNDCREKEYQRIRDHAYVQIDDTYDKYALKELPEIDCVSRIHLCRARCCSFTFRLSLQDLDEGIVKWDYARPYSVLEKPSGYCVHSCEGRGGGCSVYQNRPAACRTYDCRKDTRIWVDFDAGIPAASAPDSDSLDESSE